MSEYQNYSQSVSIESLFSNPLSSEYKELYIRNGSFPMERIFIIKNSWILANHLEKIIHINNAANIHFNSTLYGLFAEENIQKQIKSFLFQINLISPGSVGVCKIDDLLVQQKGFSIYTIPIPWLDYSKIGSGNRASSATNTYTDQEISNMNGTNRIAHMMYLALYKIAPEIAKSFTVEDLILAAGFMAAYAVSQMTAAGWAVDVAISGMAFAYAGFSGIKALSMLIKAVYMAYNATSNQQIEQAAQLAAESSVHLALDLVIAYFVHRQIRTTQGVGETTTTKQIKTNSNEWEPVDLAKPNEPPINHNPEDFFTKGYTEDQASKILTDTSTGQKMFDTIAEAHPDWSVEDIKRKAVEAIQSGKTLPQSIDNFEGTLYKIQKIQYNTVRPDTIYFTTQEEINKAAAIASNGGPSIAEQFGLPQSSIADQYGIMPMQSTSPSTIFKSVVAPSLEKGITQPGGASQYFIFNQSNFTSLPRSGSLTNNGILGK